MDGGPEITESYNGQEMVENHGRQRSEEEIKQKETKLIMKYLVLITFKRL